MCTNVLVDYPNILISMIDDVYPMPVLPCKISIYMYLLMLPTLVHTLLF